MNFPSFCAARNDNIQGTVIYHNLLLFFVFCFDRTGLSITDKTTCGNDPLTFATGVKVRTLADQGDQDDLGISDIHLICDDGGEVESPSSLDTGDWYPPLMCEKVSYNKNLSGFVKAKDALLKLVIGNLWMAML